MFDIEKALAEWRHEMRGAGIKSPLPLEELESHLREEFEEQRTAGLKDEAAFQVAVRKIGQARALQGEFRKVESAQQLKRGALLAARATLLILGWVAMSFVLLDTVFSVNWHWNFFNFSPKWDRAAATAVLLILAAEAGLWFLARASRDRVSRVVSLLVSLWLAGYAIYHVLPPEPVKAGHAKNWIEAMIGRQTPSPLWYRGGLALLCFAPGLFWMGRLLQQMRRGRQTTEQQQYV